MNRIIRIFDTTLRDGEQAPGCSMHFNEKTEAAKQLEALGVDIIEAGFPISSKGDLESVRAIAAAVKDSGVAALARAAKPDIDACVDSLKDAANPRIHIFLATSDIHMKHKLKMSKEDVLARAVETVKYARNFCADVQFSAEDATRSDWEFLAAIFREVIKAGTSTVNLPDTVGYTTPEEMYALVKYIKENVANIDKAVIAVHCHNDLGLAVANTLAGIRAGAGQAECTINGLGERAGNAALEEIVMGLKTREPYYEAQTRINTAQIYKTSKLIYNLIGQTAPINKPIIGTNAFLHESGIHQHGVLQEKTTYEIMTPESLGITKTNMILGKHSGKHAFTDRLDELGYRLTSEEAEALFVKFKELCDIKKNVSDKDIEALALNKELFAESVFKLEHFEVTSGRDKRATCVVRIRKENNVMEEVSLGDGPVDAAYNAVDKITGISCQLETYDIHAASDGKDALGEAIVKLLIDGELITGRGLSTDIIEASILAYINAVNNSWQ